MSESVLRRPSIECTVRRNVQLIECMREPSYGLARNGLAERKNVYAKENLRSPEDLGNKNTQFFKRWSFCTRTTCKFL